MFERPGSGERAVIVHLDIGTIADSEELEEFRLLADSAGAVVVGEIGGSRHAPDPRLFIGSGKSDELKSLVASENADLAIFDHTLSPAQERMWFLSQFEPENPVYNAAFYVEAMPAEAGIATARRDNSLIRLV